MTEHNSANGKIIGAIVVVVIVAAAAWWYFSHVPGLDFSRHGPAPSRPAADSAPAEPAPIEHPIASAQVNPAPAGTAPLPALDASDNPAVAALSALPGAKGLADLLIARGLIPHLVATVDALPRHAALGSSILPLRPPAGAFVVDVSSGQPMLSSAGYARYASYMQVVNAISARDAVSWYVHWYPLFQQAYRGLGYPHGYFNDRLLAAIDDMLAAPTNQGSAQLVKTPDGHYVFADPTWEGLSQGQKLMIRVGPENERDLKVKLANVRELLLGKAAEQGAPARSAPASAASASH